MPAVAGAISWLPAITWVVAVPAPAPHGCGDRAGSGDPIGSGGPTGFGDPRWGATMRGPSIASFLAPTSPQAPATSRVFATPEALVTTWALVTAQAPACRSSWSPGSRRQWVCHSFSADGVAGARAMGPPQPISLLGRGSTWDGQSIRGRRRCHSRTGRRRSPWCRRSLGTGPPGPPTREESMVSPGSGHGAAGAATMEDSMVPPESGNGAAGAHGAAAPHQPIGAHLRWPEPTGSPLPQPISPWGRRSV